MTGNARVHNLQKCDRTWVIPSQHSPLPASKLPVNGWHQEDSCPCIFPPFTGSQSQTYKPFCCLFWKYELHPGITYHSTAPLLFKIDLLQNSWFHRLSICPWSHFTLLTSLGRIKSDWLSMSSDKFADVSYASFEPRQIHRKSSASFLLGKSHEPYMSNSSRNLTLSIFLLNLHTEPSFSFPSANSGAWGLSSQSQLFKGLSLPHYCSVVSIGKFLKPPGFSLYPCPHKCCDLSCLPRLKYCDTVRLSLPLLPSVWSLYLQIKPILPTSLQNYFSKTLTSVNDPNSFSCWSPKLRFPYSCLCCLFSSRWAIPRRTLSVSLEPVSWVCRYSLCPSIVRLMAMSSQTARQTSWKLSCTFIHYYLYSIA